MNLKIKNQLFVVGGATSGFGKAVAEALLNEGAKVIALARGEKKLNRLSKKYGKQMEAIAADITQSETIEAIIKQIGKRKISGALINAGGPPAMSFLETKMKDWDNAYHSVMRWKVELTKALLPKMLKQNYGRIVYVESVSVKQPIKNLVLSNALRLGVVGFVKTLSQEVAHKGITLNTLGPGYHATPAMDRLVKKKSQIDNVSEKEARAAFEAHAPVGYMGKPTDFAELATWLLSPNSRYITGQTITVDGGLVQGTF